MNDRECLSEREAAVALDPAIGDGTPETAPHELPFGSDDGPDAVGFDGIADDDDDVEAGEDDALIDDDI